MLGHLSMILVFFFKQKTAYEMRISDWSSDVCSSDLSPSPATLPWPKIAHAPAKYGTCAPSTTTRCAASQRTVACAAVSRIVGGLIVSFIRHSPRSEEHTSELQSLLRISYAVFCLKKKNKHAITIYSE